jgi:hypothetical protein
MVMRSLRRAGVLVPFKLLLATVLSAQEAPPLDTTTWTSLGPAPLFQPASVQPSPDIITAGRVVGIPTQ